MSPSLTTLAAEILRPNETVLFAGVDADALATDNPVVAVVDVDDLAGLASDVRADVAIVVAARKDHEAGLARLRDVHCDRILLVPAVEAGWTPTELRSLGFIEFRSEGETLWLFDPAKSNPPREWNNPRNWANPENFDKFRW
jgi:hypothetical protein